MFFRLILILCLGSANLLAGQPVTQTGSRSLSCAALVKIVGSQIECGLVWNGDGRIPADIWFSDDRSRREVFRSLCEDCDYFYLGGSRISDVYRVVDNATGRVVVFKHYFMRTQAEVDTEGLEILSKHPFKSFRVIKTLGEVGTWRILENEFGLPLDQYLSGDSNTSEKSKQEMRVKLDRARAELNEWIIQTIAVHKFKHPNQGYFFVRTSNFLVTVNGELVLFDPN